MLAIISSTSPLHPGGANPQIMAATEGAPAHGNVAHLLSPSYKSTVAAWLEEDTPSFDYGGFVVGAGVAEARLLGKSEVSCSNSTIKSLSEWRVATGKS